MIVKGLDERYLVDTGMTVEEIADEISDYSDVPVRTINIVSAGWDAMFGNYAVVRASRNRLWIVSKGEVMPDNGWSRERGLY